MSETNNSEALREQQFLDAQIRLDLDRMNGTSGPWGKLREIGISQFKSTGFPETREEEWKYTPVQNWLNDEFLFSRGTDPTCERLSGFLSHVDGYVAVCVNGVLNSKLSRLPKENHSVTITTLKQALASSPDSVADHLARMNPGTKNPFASLNLAFLDNGIYIHIPDRVTLDKPLYIADLVPSDTSLFHQPRILIVAGKQAHATIIEFRGQDGSTAGSRVFENTVTQIHLSPSSGIDYYHVYDRGARARIVRTLNVYQEDNSTCSTNEIILSGSLVRSNLNFLPDGEGCQTNLNGFYLAGTNMHIDMHTLVDHAKPHCVSNELFKGILYDNATGIFNGRVLVRQDAQQINAYQSNRNVILGDKAHMYSKPELEIYADDVKCSHGATTGQLDEEALFYLRSRGITEPNARRLLLAAFASDVLKMIRVDHLREYLESHIEQLLLETKRAEA